jgi:isopropylmalate/homocitrate/citramalate synthase
VKAQSAGAYRVVLADTVGIATPKIIEEKIGAVRSRSNISVGVHLHNDLGLATGNAVIAIYSGADEVQTTVGGIGERVGNTPLEELSAIQIVDGGFKTNIVLDRVVPIVREILEILGFRVGLNKPVIGDSAFTHTTDLHIRSVIIDPRSFEAFDPSLLGADRKILITHLIGKRSIALILEKLGIDVKDIDLDSIVEEVRSRVIDRGKPFTLDEFKDFIRRRIGD